jgi:hypothetical protein
LLVLAGAYVARALTDARVVPPVVGVALGLAYAVLWQLRADREGRRGRGESAAFHALASCVIAFPLIWETTARLGLMGPRAAGAALVGFFALGLCVAWRQRLAVAAGVATGLALATGVALLFATRDLLAVFVALLSIGAGLEWLAYRERWLPLRWWAAIALDGVAFLLAALVARPEGLPERYVPLEAPAAAGALLALPALYVVGLAARTLRRGRPVTLFEVAQGTLAVLLGFGGAWRVLSAGGGSVVGLGALALLLGALCYGAAFAFAERRAGQGRNFYFYSTAGGFDLAERASSRHPALPASCWGPRTGRRALRAALRRMTLRVLAPSTSWPGAEAGLLSRVPAGSPAAGSSPGGVGGRRRGERRLGPSRDRRRGASLGLGQGAAASPRAARRARPRPRAPAGPRGGARGGSG